MLKPMAPRRKDQPGVSSDTPTSHAVGVSPRYYQLTHDYLVPSLRDWLTRKLRESRRGRAELRLAERTAFGAATPRIASCLPGGSG